MSKVGSITALLHSYAERFFADETSEQSSSEKHFGRDRSFQVLDEVELKLKKLLEKTEQGISHYAVPREEILRLLEAVEQVTLQADELVQRERQATRRNTKLLSIKPRRAQTPRPLPRLRPVSFTHPSKEERALEARIYQGRGDRVAYMVAWRLLKRGKAPDEIAATVSLPLHEVRRIEQILREEQRRSLDDAAIEQQVKTLVDELSIEKSVKKNARGSAQTGFGSKNPLKQTELVIERRQVLL